jgi:hypothetical protein
MDLEKLAPTRFCAERGRLLDDLSVVTCDYAGAVEDLSRKMGVLPQHEYILKRAEVEQMRLDAEHAREALVKHRAEHGC